MICSRNSYPNSTLVVFSFFLSRTVKKSTSFSSQSYFLQIILLQCFVLFISTLSSLECFDFMIHLCFSILFTITFLFWIFYLFLLAILSFFFTFFLSTTPYNVFPSHHSCQLFHLSSTNAEYWFWLFVMLLLLTFSNIFFILLGNHQSYHHPHHRRTLMLSRTIFSKRNQIQIIRVERV